MHPASAGLRGEELAAAREVRFQLSSALRGLGTANVAQLCGDYQVGLLCLAMCQVHVAHCVGCCRPRAM